MFALRPFQLQALEALSRPGHVLCVAPTGSGKSLIYENTAKNGRYRTLIVSPLVALARQQAERLARAGVRASIGTADPESETWIVSPEILLYPSHRAAIARFRPRFLVVDECHCLWDWGERFRPAFLLLPKLVREQAIPRSLWLTATLPVPAREELRAAIPPPLTELGGFALPAGLRLSFVRVPWVDRVDALLGWVRDRPEPGIVFAPTREATVRVARLLSALGRPAIAYHAGFSREERVALERRIADSSSDSSGDSDNAGLIVVATSAFGMGMDHPRLRWVVLWQAPPSVLALAQSVGRVCRREGDSSHALILWDEEDFRLLEWIARGSTRRGEELLRSRALLASARCRGQLLTGYFERESGPRCGRCDFCVGDSGLFSPGSVWWLGAQSPRPSGAPTGDGGAFGGGKGAEGAGIATGEGMMTPSLAGVRSESGQTPSVGGPVFF
jgi:ATP-dependent DNA helicase RecQ